MARAGRWGEFSLPFSGGLIQEFEEFHGFKQWNRRIPWIYAME